MADKKKKQGFIMNIVGIISKHYKKILFTVLAMMVAFPVIVWLMYSVLPPIFETDISADGMLSYLGSILGGVTALVAALIAVYQSRKEMEAAQEQAEEQHKSDIRPRIQIELEMAGYNKKIFWASITNCGEKSAFDIYLCEERMNAFLLPHKEHKEPICFEKVGEVRRIDIPCDERDEEGYPYEISVGCRDIDSNSLRFHFKYYPQDGQREYYLEKYEYE